MTTTQWHRVRFHANYDDSRPVVWPPLGPYWETGLAGDESYATVVAFFPVGSECLLTEFWPEADKVDWHDVTDEIAYTSRFTKPDWWRELEAQDS